jgi:hypothetical protein
MTRWFDRHPFIEAALAGLGFAAALCVAVLVVALALGLIA